MTCNTLNISYIYIYLVVLRSKILLIKKILVFNNHLINLE